MHSFFKYVLFFFFFFLQEVTSVIFEETFANSVISNSFSIINKFQEKIL